MNEFKAKDIEGQLRNWPQDFSHENGNYNNICGVCKHDFIGHKRRAFCKVCETTTNNKRGK